MTLLLSAAGCKKNSGSNDTNSNVSERTKLLTKAPWVEIAGRSSFNQTVWTDAFSGLANCEKDNQYVYALDKTYNWNQGPTNCSGPQVYEQGTWEYKSNSDENIVSLKSSGGLSNEFLILTLDANTLKAQFTTNEFGVLTVYEYTYIHP